MPRFVELMAMAQPTAQEPDANLRPWSELTESMTAAVAHHCRGQANVRLLEEGIGSVNSWEQDGYARRGLYPAVVRSGSAAPIARSMVAAIVALMQGLGERPLAELLYRSFSSVRPDYTFWHPQILSVFGVIKRISTNC